MIDENRPSLVHERFKEKYQNENWYSDSTLWFVHPGKFVIEVSVKEGYDDTAPLIFDFEELQVDMVFAGPSQNDEV